MRYTLSFTPICLALLMCVGVAHADRPAALSPQTIKLPSGPASLKGLGESFSTDASTGTGSYSVGIDLPPAMLKPSLALSYAAGRGKSGVGLSWDLPVVSVYRTTDKGSPSFAETDRFAVSGPGLNDELVRVDAGTGTYRLKNEGSYALFIRSASTDSWTVRLSSGETLFLGESAQAREGTARGTYRWYVERHTNKFAHEVRYAYTRNQSRLYLSEVRFQLQAHSENGSLVAIAAAFQNKVTFAYEARPDVFADYSYGEKVTTAQRLRTITVSQGSRVLRTYALSYRNSLLFSLLTSVQMTGESGLSMPTLSFDYLEPTLASGRYVEMVNRPPLEGLLNGSAQLEDLNRDGLPDLLVGTAGNYRYYENLDGVSWSQSPTAIAGSPDRNLYDTDVILADFDGDGDRDVGHSQGNAFRYYPAGTVWRGAFQGFGAPVTLNTSDTGFALTARELKLNDLNSDGRTDLIWQKPGQDVQLLNTNDRLQSSYITELPVDVDFQDGRVELADFNGDGVMDFVRKEIGWNPSRVRVWYGLGNGAYAAEQQMLNVPTGDASEFSLQDVNRDGQTDLVRLSGTHATYFLNDGNQRFTGARGDFYGLPSVSNTRRVMFADMNGNGTTDAVWLTLDGKLTYLDLVGEPFFGMLSRIDNGMGAMTEIAYRSSTAYLVDAKRKGVPWATTLPVPVPVIAEVVARDSLERLGVLSVDQRLSYTYGEGYYDGQEREFRGFGVALTTEWGDATHEALVTEQRLHVGRNLDTLADEEPLKGKPYVRLVKNLQGQIYQSIETKWEQRWLCQEALSGVTQVILPRCADHPNKALAKDSLVTLAVATANLTGTWEKTGAARYTAAANEYDAWGRLIRDRSYGEITFSAARTPGSGFDLAQANTGIGNDEVVTETDYIDDVADWLVGVPYQERTRSITGAILSQSRRYFDGARFIGLPLGQVDIGRISREEVWLDTENRFIASARNEHNADGLVIATQDANSNLVDISYDADTRSFPVRERLYVESGSLDFTAKYDPALGAVVESADAHGNLTRYTYDGLGRADKVIDPLGTPGVPLFDYDYEYGTTLSPISKTTIKALVDRASGSYRTSHQFSDGLGRPRLSKTQAESGHGYVASGYAQLTARGGANRVYDDFSSQHAGFEAPPASTPVVVRYLDTLSRPIDVVFPATSDLTASIVHTTYLPFESREYDERDTREQGASIAAPYDATGRSVGDRAFGGVYATVTRFDGMGRVHEIEKKNDQGGQVKTLLWKAEYDALGRIVSLKDPAWTENAASPIRDARSKRHYVFDSLTRLVELTDPNLGRIRYTYDDASNPRTRVDALNQEQGWEYGLANRLQRRTFKRDAAGKPDYAYDFHYDAPAPSSPLGGARNLLGRLAWVEYATGREHYSYDEQGRQLDEVVELWNPAASSFSAQVRDTYRRSESYDAEGKTTSVSLPGNFSVASQYNTRGLLAGLSAGPAGATRQVLSNITYDARGLATRADHGNGTRSCSAYDERGMLSATLTGRSNQVTCGPLGASGSSLGVDGIGFQHLRFVRTFNGNIGSIRDFSARLRDSGGRDSVPRLDATYRYDRLNQLVRSSDVQGTFDFGYDSTQNLISRAFTGTGAGSGLGSSTSLPTGAFGYGERGAGPNMVTSAGGRSFDYDALGRMKVYNGYALDYDVEGQLVSATKGATSVKFHYDAWGERRLSILQRASGAVEVNRHIFDEYELRNGDETWLVDGGNTQVEVTKSQGIVIDDNLYLLDQLLAYVNGSARDPKPLPAEYMDLDGDADFDMADYNLASQAYGTPVRERLGGQKFVWRYHHHDQITGTTHATDSAGDLVTHVLYDVFGKTTQPRGLAPVRGYAGADLEIERDLGLMRFGARYYAPDLGRWISGDLGVGESPVAAWATLLEANLYSYGANNPITRRDPSGLLTFEETALWIDENLISSKHLESVGNFATGIADAATLNCGAVQAVQERLDIAEVVDRNSAAYKTGEYGYTALSTAAGLQGAARFGTNMAKILSKNTPKLAVATSASTSASAATTATAVSTSMAGQGLAAANAPAVLMRAGANKNGGTHTGKTRNVSVKHNSRKAAKDSAAHSHGGKPRPTPKKTDTAKRRQFDEAQKYKKPERHKDSSHDESHFHDSDKTAKKEKQKINLHHEW